MTVAGTFALFLGALVLVALSTIVVRILALRLGAVAKKNARRRHERDTPLLGGVGIYLALAASLIFLWPVVGAAQAGSFLVAITLVFAVGVVDDFVELKAAPKLLAEVLASLIVIYGHGGPPAVLEIVGPIPEFLTIAIVVLWMVGVTNAINLIDGLDGLAAGVAGMSAATLGFILWVFQGEMSGLAAPLCFALAGACAGFLIHNYHPAKIFLGDSGSLVVGFTLAALSIQFEAKRSMLVSLSIPLMLLGLPLLDVALSVIRRRRLSRPVFQGDRSHLHHRLQQVGLNHQMAVHFLWLCSAYLNGAAFLISRVPQTMTALIYACVLPTLGFWMVALLFVEKRLSFQAARFGRLFLKQQEMAEEGRSQLVRYLSMQLESYRRSQMPFTVVVVDSSNFIKEMAHERPARMVSFYMSIFGILRDRLRSTDFVARVGDHRFVAVLEGAGDGSESKVIGQLSGEIRALEENFNVFQSDRVRPEGFKVFVFPRDAARMWQAMGIHPEEVARPEARAA